MESTNTFYPVFEPDQVLTSDHLNQLRKFLSVQDRLSRRLLHGIGVVCGLQLSNPNPNTIRISKGVGITSKGFLITIDESDCTHYQVYNDKVYNEVNCDDQIEGKYDLFLNDDDEQYNLWELFTSAEEIESNDENIKLLSEPPTEAADPLDLSQMCVLLYLEIEDMDMLACFGEDCDEKGIQRHFNVRKLLIHKDDLLKVIEEAHDYDELTESELEEDLTAKYKLKPISLKRLGYGFSNIAKTLSLKEYHDFDTLFDNYTLVIQDGIWDVSGAIFNTYDAYKFILKDLYPANPFKDFDSEVINQNPLYIKIRSAIIANRLVIQYIYDFLFDLKCAYDEFRENAFDMAVMCCPNPCWFPRHLMLGMARQPETEPVVFRHHFIYSPILGKQKDLLEKVKQYHKRIVKMLDEFNEQVLNFQDIRVTPSSPYAFPLSNRAIPFYYNVTAEGELIKLWNFDKSLRLRSNTLLSYHGSDYNLEDEFVSQPMMWENKKHDFLRIEGHVGKNYESALSNLLSQQERLNMPIKIVGVKLSKRFANTNVDVECHFDDLQTLFRTFTTELKCMLFEEAEFFRNLDTELSDSGKEAGVRDAKTGMKVVDEGEGLKKKDDASKKIINLFGAKSAEVDETGDKKKFSVDADVGGGSNYNIDAPVFGVNYDFNYSQASEGSVGFLMDMISTGSAQNPYTTIFNMYATGQLGIFYPGIFIYTILYPVQIATNIDTLLNNVPEKLEDLEIKTLKKDYDALVESASGFKVSIQENLNDPNYERSGNEEVLLYRLDKLIYHCSIKKIVALYQLYLKRIEEVQQKNLFSQFAKEHPGMEHMAGVPKGGTLVLVYIDTNDMTSKEQGKDLEAKLASGYDYQVSKYGNENIRVWGDEIRSAKEKNPGKRAVTSSGKNIGGGRNINTNVEYLNSGLRIGDDKVLSYFQQNQGAIPFEIIDRYIEAIGLMQFNDDDLPPNNIVVADFALPYLCCGSCSEIATMVIAQIVFRLDGTEFCRSDSSFHNFTTEPSGGTISGPGVVTVNDITTFQPSEINDDEWQENITLTYLVNNQQVVLNIKVYNPIAAFSASDPDPIEGGGMRVSFTNEGSETGTYRFDFGDDETFEGAIFPSFHDYKLVENGQTVTVNLEVEQGPCTATAEPVTIEFKLEDEPTFSIEREVACNNLEALKVYFTATPDPDAEFKIESSEGLPVLQDGDGYYFVPYNLNPGTYTFKYRELERSIYIANAISFQIYTIPDPEKPSVYTFTYMGEPYKSIKWSLRNNGENIFTDLENNIDEITLEFNDEQLPAEIRAIVENEIGCTSTEIVTVSPAEVEFSIEDNNVCNNLRSLKVYFVTNPMPEEGSEISSSPVVNIEQDAGGYFFKPFSLNPDTYNFYYEGITVSCAVHEPVVVELSALPNPDKEFEYTISYDGEPFKDITWSIMVNGINKFIELPEKTTEIVLNFQKNQLPAIVRAQILSIHGCVSSGTVEIKIEEATLCYSVDILNCWNDNVLEMTNINPVVIALQDRGEPIVDNMIENINRLLEIFAKPENCGFDEEMDIMNPEGCLNLGGIDSRFYLLQCMTQFGIIVEGFDPKNYDEYKEKPSALDSYIIDYQRNNCCPQQGEPMFMVAPSFWTAVPASERKRILTNRGVKKLTDKTDDELLKLIRKTDSGFGMSEKELNYFSLKTLKALLKSKNISTRGLKKKAEFIDLLI